MSFLFFFGEACLIKFDLTAFISSYTSRLVGVLIFYFHFRKYAGFHGWFKASF